MNALPRLQRVFRDVFDDDDLVIQDGTTARDIPDWDSLTHVQLIVAAEAEFGVRFQAAEITGLLNVGELRRVIERKLAGA